MTVQYGGNCISQTKVYDSEEDGRMFIMHVMHVMSGCRNMCLG